MDLKQLSEWLGVKESSIRTEASGGRSGVKVANWRDITDSELAKLLAPFAKPHPKRNPSTVKAAIQMLEYLRDNAQQEEQEPQADASSDAGSVASDEAKVLTQDSIEVIALAASKQHKPKRRIAFVKPMPQAQQQQIDIEAAIQQAVAQAIAEASKMQQDKEAEREEKKEEPQRAPVPEQAPAENEQATQEQRPASHKVFTAVFACIVLWQMVHTGYLEYSISKFQNALGVVMAILFAVGVQLAGLLLTMNYARKGFLLIAAIIDIAVNLLCYFPNERLAIVLLSLMAGITIYSFSELFIKGNGNLDEAKKTGRA